METTNKENEIIDGGMVERGNEVERVEEVEKVEEVEGADDISDDGELFAQMPKSREIIDGIRKKLSKTQYRELFKELTRSMILIEGFRAATDINDDNLDCIISGLLTQSLDIVKGIISPECIKRALRVANYDRDMALSRHEGVIEGRNTRISQLMKEYEPSDPAPRMPSSATSTPTSNSIFDLADSAR